MAVKCLATRLNVSWVAVLLHSQYRCRSLCCGGQEASWTLESLFAYTTPAMENSVAVVSDRLLGVTIQYRLRNRARLQTSLSNSLRTPSH